VRFCDAGPPAPSAFLCAAGRMNDARNLGRVMVTQIQITQQVRASLLACARRDCKGGPLDTGPIERRGCFFCSLSVSPKLERGENEQCRSYWTRSSDRWQWCAGRETPRVTRRSFLCSFFSSSCVVRCAWLWRRVTDRSHQDHSCSPRWFSVRLRFRACAALRRLLQNLPDHTRSRPSGLRWVLMG
jgi:hypothetical protein